MESVPLNPNCPLQPGEGLRRRLDNARKLIDDKKLTFDRGDGQDPQPVVSVVRPPRYRHDKKPPTWNCSYGIARGVIQKSEQIQLSFERKDAERMCKVALDARKAGLNVIEPDSYMRDLTDDKYVRCDKANHNGK